MKLLNGVATVLAVVSTAGSAAADTPLGHFINHAGQEPDITPNSYTYDGCDTKTSMEDCDADGKCFLDCSGTCWAKYDYSYYYDRGCMAYNTVFRGMNPNFNCQRLDWNNGAIAIPRSYRSATAEVQAGQHLDVVVNAKQDNMSGPGWCSKSGDPATVPGGSENSCQCYWAMRPPTESSTSSDQEYLHCPCFWNHEEEVYAKGNGPYLCAPEQRCGNPFSSEATKRTCDQAYDFFVSNYYNGYEIRDHNSCKPTPKSVPKSVLIRSVSARSVAMQKALGRNMREKLVKVELNKAAKGKKLRQ